MTQGTAPLLTRSPVRQRQPFSISSLALGGRLFTFWVYRPGSRVNFRGHCSRVSDRTEGAGPSPLLAEAGWW